LKYQMILDWLNDYRQPAILVGIGALVWLAKWIFKDALPKYFASAIDSKFNKELEQVRSERKKSEASLVEQFTRERQLIESLQAGTLELVSQRQQVLYARKLKGAEALWGSVYAFRKYYLAINLLKSLNVVVISERVKDSQEIKDFVKSICRPFNLDKIDLGEAALHQPFVSEALWISFNVLSGIIASTVLELTTLNNGLSPTLLRKDRHDGNFSRLRELGLVNGELDPLLIWDDYSNCLLQLESNIISEIRKLCAGQEDTEDSLVGARRVASAVRGIDDNQLDDLIGQIPKSLRRI
jgi:hypothetical protein